MFLIRQSRQSLNPRQTRTLSLILRIAYGQGTNRVKMLRYFYLHLGIVTFCNNVVRRRDYVIELAGNETKYLITDSMGNS